MVNIQKLVILAAIAFGLVQGASANLLVNGNFDTGTISPWVTYQDGGAIAAPGIMTSGTVWTPGNPTSDGYMLGVGYAGNMRGGNSGAYQTFSVAPGTPLRITGDIAGGVGGFGNFNGTARWEIRLIDGGFSGPTGGTLLWSRQQTSEGGFGWTSIDVTTVAGSSGTATLVLNYGAWDPQGVWAYFGAYFDTLAVEETTLPPVIISNVAVTAFTDTTATIEWDTNVLSTSTVYWGLAPVPPYSNSATGPDGTHHAVNLTGLPPGSIIHYSVRSTAAGYEPASSPDADFATPIQFRDIAWQWGATPQEMVITWNTVIDARRSAEDPANQITTTSQVRYGTDPNNLDQLSTFDPTLTSAHSVTLTNLDVDTKYFYRVIATKPGYTDMESEIHSFETIAIQPELMNGDFEAKDALGNPTLAPWRIFGKFDGLHGPGVPPPNDNLFGVPPHSPTHYCGDVESYGNEGDMSGVFQRVATNQGQDYVVSAFVYTQEVGGAAQDVGCRIGVDPTGGIDPNSPNVIWHTSDLGPFYYTQTWNPPYTQLGWQQIALGFTAASNCATVFLQVHHQWALAWNITAFDDVALGVPATTVAEAKSHPAGWSVDLANKAVTYAYELEPAFCYIEDDNRVAGIKVAIPSGGPIPMVGDRIDVQGATEVVDGEARIRATSLTIGTPAPPPPPVCVINKSVDGGQSGPQPGVPGATGLATTGLLVRVFGRCVAVDWMSNPANWLYPFWIDDGSGVDGGSSYQTGEPVRGLKVYYGLSAAPFEAGHYLLVTGVAGVEMYDPTPEQPTNGDQYPIRVLYVRNDSDILDLGP